MIERGFRHGDGVGPFLETYGLLETITTIEPAENACSEAKVTRRVRRRPGGLAPSVRRFSDAAGRVCLPRRHRSRPASIP